MTEKELNRYNRQIILSEIGLSGQQKLKDAKVLVIGAGGLGCPLLFYLAAAGVGHIGMIDGDQVEESNLQRQILYSSADIGKYKAEIAKEKLESQNPFINLTAHTAELTPQNALSVLSDYDIIVDGSDNFPTRYLVGDACAMLNKPLVFGSIYKFQGQVSVFNYKEGPTYRCLYPEAPPAEESPNCSEIGVIATLPGIIGTLQANEVIKILTGVGEPLSGKLLTLDALSMKFETFRFSLVEENKSRTLLTDYSQSCNSTTKEIFVTKEISSETLKLKIASEEKFQLIDVRESSEHERDNIGGELIPINSLLQNLDKIKKEIPVIFYCQSGIRSKKAVEILAQKGYENVSSLKNGIRSFQKTVFPAV